MVPHLAGTLRIAVFRTFIKGVGAAHIGSQACVDGNFEQQVLSGVAHTTRGGIAVGFILRPGDAVHAVKPCVFRKPLHHNFCDQLSWRCRNFSEIDKSL